MGGTAFASPIVLTKLKAASNVENITKKHSLMIHLYLTWYKTSCLTTNGRLNKYNIV